MKLSRMSWFAFAYVVLLAGPASVNLPQARAEALRAVALDTTAQTGCTCGVTVDPPAVPADAKTATVKGNVVLGGADCGRCFVDGLLRVKDLTGDLLASQAIPGMEVTATGPVSFTFDTTHDVRKALNPNNIVEVSLIILCKKSDGTLTCNNTAQNDAPVGPKEKKK